jgi:hypothetical protein
VQGMYSDSPLACFWRRVPSQQRGLPLNEVQVVAFGITKKEEAHAGEQDGSGFERDSGGLQLRMGCFQVVDGECEVAQTGVANLRLGGRLIRFHEFEDYGIWGLDVDGGSGIQQESEIEVLDIPGCEVLRVGGRDGHMLDAFDQRLWVV